MPPLTQPEREQALAMFRFYVQATYGVLPSAVTCFPRAEGLVHIAIHGAPVWFAWEHTIDDIPMVVDRHLSHCIKKIR